MIQVSELSIFLIIHSICSLHELLDIHLIVPVSRNSSTYGNDLAQILFLMMRMIKQIMVHRAASTFIRRLLLKLAFCPSFQTFFIHRTKNHTIGPMQMMNSQNAHSVAACLYNKNKKKVASANTIEQKMNVPLFPNNILMVCTPSALSSSCW